MARKSKEELKRLREERKAKEQIERDRKSMLRDRAGMERQDIPEPCHVFEVGDRVCFGAWDWSAVLEVCRNGKFYKIISVTRHTNCNVPDHSVLKIHYIQWYDLLPYRTEEEIPIERFESTDYIHFNYQNRDIRGLLYMYFSDYGFDLNPEYQRGNVWTLEQKQALIRSIFDQVDIGKFAVIKRPWGSNPSEPLTPKLYEVLDGKQRITALVEFFLGRFEYNGRTFHELHPLDQSHFRNYSVSYAETTPLTKAQKYRYFLRLNTTGTPVDPAHMEKVRNMLKEEQVNEKG
jgi:hypothetical protein